MPIGLSSGHLVCDVLGLHGRGTQLRVLPPALKHGRFVHRPLLADLAIHRRHLLALLPEHLSLERVDLTHQDFELGLQAHSPRLPTAATVNGRARRRWVHALLVRRWQRLVEFSPRFMVRRLPAQVAASIAVVAGLG